MSANKTALLGNAAERKIIEHDRALKGLKVKQYVSTDALEMRVSVEATDAVANINNATYILGPGETTYGSFGASIAKDGKMGIPLPFFNFFVDVNNDPDYYWMNGPQIVSSGRRKLLYGWKYSSVDFDGRLSGPENKGKQQIDFWIKNEDTVPHQYFLELVWLTSYVVERMA